MKIAVSSTGPDVNSQVDPRFGRAKYFIIYDTESNETKVIDNTVNLNAAQGAGIQSAQNIVDNGVNTLVTGNVGPKAFNVLQIAGVNVFTGASGSISDALKSWETEDLNPADKANVEGHWM